MTKRQQPERALQVAVFDYLRRAMPAESFFSAIPGGDRQVTLTPGYVPGLPDILILFDDQTIFIELKSKAGRLTQEQKDVAFMIYAAGGVVTVCRSVEEVEAFLRSRNIPLRATTQPSKVAA